MRGGAGVGFGAGFEFVGEGLLPRQGSDLVQFDFQKIMMMR